MDVQKKAATSRLCLRNPQSLHFAEGLKKGDKRPKFSANGTENGEVAPKFLHLESLYPPRYPLFGRRSIGFAQIVFCSR